MTYLGDFVHSQYRFVEEVILDMNWINIGKKNPWNLNNVI